MSSDSVQKRRTTNSIFWPLLLSGLILWLLLYNRYSWSAGVVTTGQGCSFLSSIFGGCSSAVEGHLNARGSPRALLFSRGDLGSRLYTLCASHALATEINIPLRVVWSSDEWLPTTQFSDLFANEEFDVVDDINGSFAVSADWKSWREVAEAGATSRCAASGASATPRLLPDWGHRFPHPNTLYLSPSVDPCRLQDERLAPAATCDLAARLRSCYSKLKPSAGVLGMMIGLNWTDLRNSGGVLIQGGAPVEPPPALLRVCATAVLSDVKPGVVAAYATSPPPAAENTAAAAAVSAVTSASEIVSPGTRRRRKLLSSFLPSSRSHKKYDESTNEGLNENDSSEEGSNEDTLNEDEEFSESITLPSSSSELLSDRWQGPNLTSSSSHGGSEVENTTTHTSSSGERARRRLMADGGSAAIRGNRPLRRGRCSAEGRLWEDDAEQLLRSLVLSVLSEPEFGYFFGGAPVKAIQSMIRKIHPARRMETIGFATLGMQRTCHGSLTADNGLTTFGPEEVAATGEVRATLVACAQRQLAELFALSETRHLIYNFPSGATDFIMARASLTSQLPYVSRPALCERSRIRTIKSQRWTEFMDVDEKAGMIYCAMPKVACTTFRNWVRSIKGYPALKEPEDIHDIGINGLTTLKLHYPEDKIIELLTNPYIFRFSIVRNPWNRILSSYLDKHVHGGVVERDRHSWNDNFFRRLPPGSYPGRDTDGFIEFPDFVAKCGQAIRRYRADVDAHIAPQADMCALNSIKYHLIIPFEKMNEGVQALSAALRLKERGFPEPPIKQKDKVYSTGSSNKLKKYFNQQTVEAVRRAYYMDMHFPLNNVKFEPPEAIVS
eukprot:TRINITY_DN1445_c0_g1_i1.p1 TRINITY_DN1445_c0_g1~~TRINITY_DN1445_c0_g1_i1.p1  ORF type:complete len:838 (+),score=57.44 TRINITY_DN1445_c0_g1_i1:480-2993(+)